MHLSLVDLSDSLGSSTHELRAVLASIVENTDDAIIGKRLDGTITVWNRAAEHLFGYTAAEMIGQNIIRLLPPERLTEENYIIDRLSRGEKIDHYQSVRRTKSGRLIHVALTVSPIRDVNGKITGASKIARDITHTIETEAALRESEARFRQLADALPQIVWEADASGTVDYYNQRWYEFTGLPDTNDLPTGPYHEQVVHADDMERAARRWSESLRTGRPHLNEARLRNGTTMTYRWHLIRSVPVRGETGRIVRWLGTSTDIDDLRRAEERTKEQQGALAHMERIRTMGQMASGLAHELNQPLGAILNYSVVLQSTLGAGTGANPKPDVQPILAEIVAQSVRAGEIIRRMRTFVKKQQPHAHPEKINALVQEAMEMLAFDLRQAQLSPQLDLGEGLPLVLVDSVQIQQVIINLVRNAIDAMANVPASQRQLVVTTRRGKDGRVGVEVADRGCGISPNDLARIFDSFFTTKPAGLGMGLALCRTIVEDHGGHLTARANDDAGATFSFSLRPAPLRTKSATDTTVLTFPIFKRSRGL